MAGKQVSGEVFADELVEGDVGVEGFEHVVPETPGVLEKQRAPAAAGFRKAGDVQPVAAPGFSKVRAGQQRIHKRGDGGLPVFGCVLEEGVQLRGGRRQPQQVVVKPAREHGQGGVRRGGDSGLLHRGQREAVQLRAGPLRVGDCGQGGLLDRCVRPELAARFEAHAGLLFHQRRLGPGVRRPHADPFFKHRDFLLGQALLRGHLHVAVGVVDGLHQQTLFRGARMRGRAGIPPLEPAFAGIQPEPPLDLLLGAVAFVATLHQHGPHLFLKKVRARIRPGEGGGGEPQGKRKTWG